MSGLNAEFIRRAVCVVFPFLWLLVHGLCLAFGAVECHPNGDGTWTCSGDGGSQPPSVVTNVLGVCTNCVAMSPSDCEFLKNQIWTLADSTRSSLGHVRFEDVKSQVDSYISMLSSYRDSVPDLYPPYFDGYNEIVSESQAAYENGIWCLQDVGSVLTSKISDLEDERQEISTSLDSIVGFVNDVDCSTCLASVTGPSDIGVPGGGSGGGGTVSGGSCTNCVCKEQLEAILKVLKGKTTIVEDETREVESIASTVDRLKTSFESFKKYMKDIFEGHTHITITDGNWTNVYLTGHASGFDYNKSNVLERIELLLWSLTALNTPSNTTSYLDGKEINGVEDAIDENLDSVKRDIEYATNDVNSVRSSLVALVSALQPLGDSSGGFSNTLMPHTEFNLGDGHFDVPDLVSDRESMSSASGFFDALRLSFQVMYLAGSVYCIWAFWAVAMNKSLFFVKWVGEILTAFFG